MSGSAQYSLSAADLETAYRFHSGMLWREPRTILTFATGSAFVAVAYFGRSDASWQSAIQAIAIGLLFAGLIVAFSFALVKWQVPRQARRIFGQQKALHAPITISWNANDIEFEQPHFHGRHAWADFVKWGASADMLLLYQSDMVFNPIPGRALSPEAWADIIDALTAAGIARVGSRR